MNLLITCPEVGCPSYKLQVAVPVLVAIHGEDGVAQLLVQVILDGSSAVNHHLFRLIFSKVKVLIESLN